MDKKDLKIEKVVPTDKQIDELYQLLIDRKYSISHFKVPTFLKHATFVKNHPYRYWALIRFNREVIGGVYIQYDNSVGLNFREPSLESVNYLLEYIQNNFIPEPAIPSMIRKDFFINLPTDDEEMISIVRNLGLKERSLSFPLQQGT